MPRNGEHVWLERLQFVNGKWMIGEWPVKAGMLIERCQCMQEIAGTDICKGISKLTFKECNLTNAVTPGDAKVERSLRIEKSFCSHLNPHMKSLPECPKDCVHADAYTPAVEIDGQIIAPEVHVRSDKLMSHTPGTTGVKVVDKTEEDLEADASAIFGKPIKAAKAATLEVGRG